MPTIRALLLGLMLAAAASQISVAAEPEQCLSPEARRAAVSEHRAVPLARAMRAAKHRYHGDVVRARLCEGGGRLLYLLTVLAQDGKVTRAVVDAASGRLIGG